MPQEIMLLIYVAIAFVVMLVLFNGIFYGAMFMAIPKKKLKKIMELAQLKEGMTVYDLGAGYGRIMLEAAKSGAQVTGYEIDKAKVFWIQQQIKMKMQYNAEILNENLLHADLSQCDVAFAYLSPPLMVKLGEAARIQMKKGAKIISVEHEVPNWQPTYKDPIDKIYIYTKQ
jgi:16S rRNA A1518/A1519 N6-dimethyltransferase RsmA/KsgA/DIM1 with predicted DNA glycosylase/AP lyase activity